MSPINTEKPHKGVCPLCVISPFLKFYGNSMDYYRSTTDTSIASMRDIPFLIFPPNLLDFPIVLRVDGAQVVQGTVDGAGAGGIEEDDSFAREVIVVYPRVNDTRTGVPPDRKPKVDSVVGADVGTHLNHRSLRRVFHLERGA